MSSQNLSPPYPGPMPPSAYDHAPSVTVVEGEIVFVGPGALAFSMTREAAEEMGRRLALVLDA